MVLDAKTGEVVYALDPDHLSFSRATARTTAKLAAALRTQPT